MSCFLFDTFLFSLYITVLDRHQNNVASIFLTLLMFDRRCFWNSMSLQMCVWQISHASLLYSSGGINIHFWRTLAIWPTPFRPSYLVSSCFKCCSYEICRHWWVTWASANPTRVPNWSLLSLPRITKWGTSYRFCVAHVLSDMCCPDFFGDWSCPEFWLTFCYFYRSWKLIGLKSHMVTCTGCISWVPTPSVNRGISHTVHQNK